MNARNFYFKFASLALAIEESIDSEDLGEKTLKIEEIRSIVECLANMAGAKFEHTKVKYYTSLGAPMIEMALVGMRNASINLDIDDVNKYCFNMDEILYMLDRFNELKRKQNEYFRRVY